MVTARSQVDSKILWIGFDEAQATINCTAICHGQTGFHRFDGGGSIVHVGKPQPEPSFTDLLEAAAGYLSRYAGNEAAVVRVLERRIARWARSAEGEPSSIAAKVARARLDIGPILERLRHAGALDDARYAAGRARRMGRSGRSRLAIESDLTKRGISRSIRQQAIATDSGDELRSALVTARRRGLGPFRDSCASELLQKDMAALARAGFPEEIVRRILQLSHTEATLILQQTSTTAPPDTPSD